MSIIEIIKSFYKRFIFIIVKIFSIRIVLNKGNEFQNIDTYIFLDNNIAL